MDYFFYLSIPAGLLFMRAARRTSSCSAVRQRTEDGDDVDEAVEDADAEEDGAEAGAEGLERFELDTRFTAIVRIHGKICRYKFNVNCDL